MEIAVFGAGCFWCVEAVFGSIEGISEVKPGYMGGKVKNPTYKEVCSGLTGHAEVAQVIFDPTVISFKKLLEVFFNTHNPTTLNRQGGDIGTQYRSAIFYTSESQKNEATQVKNALEQSDLWEDPIVTEISEASVFYEAENYHHDYFAQNGEEQYCKMVVRPKVEKFKKVFADILKG